MLVMKQGWFILLISLNKFNQNVKIYDAVFLLLVKTDHIKFYDQIIIRIKSKASGINLN